MFSSHHCRERVCPRDISTQPLLKAQNKFSVMALRTITRFSSLQHVPLSLDFLTDDTFSSQGVPSERFCTTSGGLSCVPNSRTSKSAVYICWHTSCISQFSECITPGCGCSFVCLFFTKPTQLGHPPPTIQGPWRVSSEVLTHPYIFRLCSDHCISPLILPLLHLTSGQIAKGIFDILI